MYIYLNISRLKLFYLLVHSYICTSILYMCGIRGNVNIDTHACLCMEAREGDEVSWSITFFLIFLRWSINKYDNELELPQSRDSPLSINSGF